MTAPPTPSQNGAPALRLENVSRSYGRGERQVRALDEVSLSVEAGELAAVVGPSGSGKTTLLQVAGAMDRPSSGRVLHGTTDLTTLAPARLAEIRLRSTGFVFQFFNLLPGLTALENVALVARLGGVGRREAGDRARALLARVGLEGRHDHLPSALSGGEQQRVAIARAVVNEPRLVLADEPTGNLDRRTGAAVVELLVELARDQGAAVVIVTHDALVHDYVERTLTMIDGRLVDGDRSVDGEHPSGVSDRLVDGRRSNGESAR